jgi:hypothetical protein
MRPPGGSARPIFNDKRWLALLILCLIQCVPPKGRFPSLPQHGTRTLQETARRAICFAEERMSCRTAARAALCRSRPSASERVFSSGAERRASWSRDRLRTPPASLAPNGKRLRRRQSPQAQAAADDSAGSGSAIAAQLPTNTAVVVVAESQRRGTTPKTLCCTAPAGRIERPRDSAKHGRRTPCEPCWPTDVDFCGRRS